MKSVLLAMTFPVFFALIMHTLFDNPLTDGLFVIMSLAFLLGIPIGIGILTIYLSPGHLVEKRYYRILAPLVPILLFFLVTILLSIEGWVCWIMILPIFLIAAMIGGSIGGRMKLKNRKK